MTKNDEFLLNYEVKEIARMEGAYKTNVSIDAGSSGTRTHLWDSNPKSGGIYEISSGYSVVNNDMSAIRSQSDALYDNLEIIIEDLTEGKVDKVFDSIHIVKGGLLEDMRLPVARTNSNSGKGLQNTTYINAIANIGIRAYMFAFGTGIARTEIVPNVTLALPQEDIISSKRQAEIKYKLSGTYVFKLPRCSYEIKITIRESEILLIDEAQAVLGYWRIENKVDISQYPGVLIIDAGGRSVDLSLMLKGRVLAKGSNTCKFGGQKFIDLIINNYVNETGNNMPTVSMVQDALDTGLLQDGNASIDITEFIDKAKTEIVDSIVNDVASLLDTNELRMNQLNLVLCAGRLTRETKNDKASVAPLTVYVEKHVKAISPNTTVGRITEEFALVKGLSLARFAYDNKKNK